MAYGCQTPSAQRRSDQNHGSVFSCANLVMMVFTVGAGVIIALLVIKVAELQQLNTEQQQNIDHLETGAETLEGKLKEIILESKTNDVSNEAREQSLQIEKDALHDQIKELELELLRKSKLKEANEKMKSEIATLTNEKLSIGEIHDNALRSIKAKAQDFSIVISKKDNELLIKSKTIKSLEDEIQTLTYSNINISNEVQTLEKENVQCSEELESKLLRINSLESEIQTLTNSNTKLSNEVKLRGNENVGLSDELLGKASTIKVLEDQIQILSNDIVSLEKRKSQRIEILEEERRIVDKASEVNIEKHLQEQITANNMIKELEDEKNIREKRIIDLKSEHQAKLNILEDSRKQMMEMIKSEKQESNALSDEKTALVRSLEDIQLEMDQVVHKLKMAVTSQYLCGTKTEMEKKHEHENNNEKKF